jgi:hypothetical protein
MFDQWLVDSAHDYYEDVPIPSFVEKVLVEICAGRKEGKSIREIKKYLNELGVAVTIRDIRGVLTAHQQHTGEDFNVQPNTQ